MTKKNLNQNTKFIQKLINTFEPDFIFSEKPINRVVATQNTQQNDISDKASKLSELKKQINSIENCILKNNSKNLILGDGNVNSPIMFIGEAPGKKEDNSGLLFQDEVGNLLNKMLLAIEINIKNVYLAYSVNFRTPEDRKPTSQNKTLLIISKEHISIINPAIIS